MIRGKNIILLMDSHLEGKFSTEEATVVVNLASQCLQYEPRERPNTKDLVATLAQLQTKPDVKNFAFSSYCIFQSLYLAIVIGAVIKLWTCDLSVSICLDLYNLFV